jgi:hypothetical protein
MFFLLFPHSSFHHSSFLISTRPINYFISTILAFSQQFFFHPLSFYPLFQFLLNCYLLLLNDRQRIIWYCHFIYIFFIFLSSLSVSHITYYTSSLISYWNFQCSCIQYIPQNQQKIACFPTTGNPVASDMEGRRMCVVHHKKEDERVTLESKTMRSRLIWEELSGGMDGGWKI